MFTTQLMRQPSWHPWQEMQRLSTELNRAFDEFRRTEVSEYPPINVWTNEVGARVTALLPGFRREDLEITVVGDTVTIKGTPAAEKLDEGQTFHRQERGTQKFARTVELSFQVDANAVKASLKNGVLEIELPRIAAEMPRKIAVTA